MTNRDYEKYYLDKDNSSRNEQSNAVFNLYKEINDLLTSKRFNEVDTFLTEIDLTRLISLLKVGTLRITFPARGLLKNWYVVRDKIRDLLVEEGRNVDKLLQGLYREGEPTDNNTMYVIESNREDVKFYERTIIDISSINNKSKRYKLNNSPYEIDIPNNETYASQEGYGTGIGDLWEWSYICTLNKEIAEKLFEEEKLRIKDKYGNQ